MQETNSFLLLLSSSLLTHREMDEDEQHMSLMATMDGVCVCARVQVCVLCVDVCIVYVCIVCVDVCIVYVCIVCVHVCVLWCACVCTCACVYCVWMCVLCMCVLCVCVCACVCIVGVHVLSHSWASCGCCQLGPPPHVISCDPLCCC